MGYVHFYCAVCLVLALLPASIVPAQTPPEAKVVPKEFPESDNTLNTLVFESWYRNPATYHGTAQFGHG